MKHGCLLPRLLPRISSLSAVWLLVAWGLDPTVLKAADAVLTGALKLQILPEAAATAGATWSIDDNPATFASSELVQSLTPGLHQLKFADLADWKEPTSLEVLIVGGTTNRVTAQFSRIPTFPLRDIPDQSPRQGETLEFFVEPEPGENPIQMTVSPTPAGSAQFDAALGLFRFRSELADRSPFLVSFSTGGVQVASLTLDPAPVVTPEEVVINYDRALPDSESRDYMVISETSQVVPALNDVTNVTALTVEISGKTLVFAADHSARLLQQFSGRENIQELRLHADRVIIRNPLILPQTRVVIHARELRFEQGGLIDTTPRARALRPPGAVWEDDRTAGIDGSPGHDAGDVDLFVERFHSESTAPALFVLRGGVGGPAGEGRDGRGEGTVPFLSADWSKLMGRAGNPVCGTSGGSSVMLYLEERFNNEVTDTCGSKVTARGENAVPSGRPGAGGRGGRLRSTVNLSGLGQFDGGLAGSKGADHVGGTLTARKFIYRVSKTTIRNGIETTSNSDSNAPKASGKNAAAPTGINGATGSFELVQDGTSWLTSFVVRQVVEFAKDAYLNGHIDEARTLLFQYSEALRVFTGDGFVDVSLPDAVFAEVTNLNRLALEMESLLHRIDSNLDFFGNPAGWVPMLSFEANLLSFEREIDQSIPILYLAYWLNQAATNQLNSLAASSLAVEKLGVERGDLESAFNEAQVAIPGLKVESDNIRLQIGTMMGRIASLERDLLERAQQNVEDRHKVPFWKKALGVLSMATHLVPVGQPVVGRIGSGLGLLSQVDTDNPVESASALAPKAFEAFSAKDIRVCFSGSTTNSTNSATLKKEKIARLTECGKFLSSELKPLAALFKEAQIDSKEIAAELEKLKASDPVFKQLTTQLQELNVVKEQFAQKLAATLQAVTTLTSALAENSLATLSLEERVALALTTLDHNALLHIHEMERRAKDRLLKFQYFVAKAFQYRTLQPYRGNLQLNRIFDRFKALVEGGGSHLLTEDEFLNLKALYLDELRDVASQTTSFLNANAPEQSLPVRITLEASELEQLNGPTRKLSINLGRRVLFPTFHENIRIANLRTRSITAHPAGGPLGANALLFLNLEHQGISRVTAGPQTFLFRHYQTESVNPITWNTVFDGNANTFNNSDLSVSSQSLLKVLLDQPTEGNLQLFSRPSAGADIVIRKEVRTSNGIDLVIDRLELELVYEFDSTRPNQPALDVVVSGNLEPVIRVSRADLNGRRDGQGDFRRVYPVGSALTLQAPARYGALAFDRWVINGQEKGQGITQVGLPMSAATTAEARYLQPDSDLRLALLPVGDGQIGFRFSTEPGVRYVIEQSTRMGNVTWQPVESRTGDGTPFQFTRSIGALDASFFRVRTE